MRKPPRVRSRAGIHEPEVQKRSIGRRDSKFLSCSYSSFTLLNYSSMRGLSIPFKNPTHAMPDPFYGNSLPLLKNASYILPGESSYRLKSKQDEQEALSSVSAERKISDIDEFGMPYKDPPSSGKMFLWKSVRNVKSRKYALLTSLIHLPSVVISLGCVILNFPTPFQGSTGSGHQWQVANSSLSCVDRKSCENLLRFQLLTPLQPCSTASNLQLISTETWLSCHFQQCSYTLFIAA
jgi:hypothetical protein